MSTDERSETPAGNETAPEAGWYPDVTNPGHERLWTGERWIAWIRPTKGGRVEADPAGWRPDAGHPGFERLWTGEMWTEEIRRVREADASAPAVPARSASTFGVLTAATAPAGLTSSVGPLLVTPPTAPRSGAIYHDAAPTDKLGTLGNWVRLALAVLIVANVAEIIANWSYINVEGEILHGPMPTFAHYVSSVNRVRTTDTVTLLVEGAAAILFVIWFYRAYRNLVRAGMGDLRFSPAWAIGGWFIPIFSLFRQKQIANDIWKASEGAATVGPERRHGVALPAALNWWWGLWIFSGMATAIGNLTIKKVKAGEVVSVSGLNGTRTGVWFDQVGLVAGIVALVLIIGLVRRISQAQDAHFRSPAELGDEVSGQLWAPADLG